MVLCGGLGQVLVSCGDLLDQKSDRVIYSDKEHLNNASDTLYSVIGIMNKIQALADRTVLLGERFPTSMSRPTINTTRPATITWSSTTATISLPMRTLL